jgi:hypothetical protein
VFLVLAAAFGEIRCLARNLDRREWRESGSKPMVNFDPLRTWQPVAPRER